MLLIREIMYCKPGKVRPMVDKFLAMSKLGEKSGMPPMRIMTDFSAERYWTVVAEMEVQDLQAFEQMMSAPPGSRPYAGHSLADCEARGESARALAATS